MRRGRFCCLHSPGRACGPAPRRYVPAASRTGRSGIMCGRLRALRRAHSSSLPSRQDKVSGTSPALPAGRRGNTRAPAALPLSYARLGAQEDMADGAGIEPARPEGLGALASRCLTARPTIHVEREIHAPERSASLRSLVEPSGWLEHPTCRLEGGRSHPLSYEGKLVSVGGFEPPISWFQARQGRPGSPTR
jgi:hypothetical protein